jgi:hypothetical protein
MATSNVSIANLALQKLGAASIVVLTPAPGSAADMSSCFESIRDDELRKYRWKFAIRRATLAAHATAPLFTYTRAFPLPTDYLSLIKPARLGLDWHIENHEGVVSILSNDGTTLDIRYIARITDPALFDPSFVQMFACKLAWQCCERITQSNTKRESMMQEYELHRKEARRANAFELPAQAQPVDEWLIGRQSGQLVNSEWAEE